MPARRGPPAALPLAFHALSVPTRLAAARLLSRRHARLAALPALLVAALVLLPLLTLVRLASRGTDAWPHLLSTVLPGAALKTLLLALGVCALSLLFGVSTALLVSLTRFPGRRVAEVLLVLPLAVPTYISAYAYLELLDYTGPVQGALRAVMGYRTARDYWFPELRSLPGAILVMGSVLYPYVYVTTRLLLLSQSAHLVEVARTLKAGGGRLVFRIILPLARPAVAAGLGLVIMECLNDIGAVEFFGVRTLTFSVYETWLARGDLAGAAQLALALLAVVALLLLAERVARRERRYDAGRRAGPVPPRLALSGWAGLGALLACLAPPTLGFLAPASVLIDQAWRRLDQFAEPAVRAAAVNSLGVALGAALAALLLALLLVHAARASRDPLVAGAVRLSTLGYAVPGTVLGIGILVPLAALDNLIDAASRATLGVATGLLLTGSGGAIVFAATVRFLAVATGAVEAGYARISPHLDAVSRTLGRGAASTLLHVHLPLLTRAVAAALLLVFVDTMKELPATLLLRPFDFETLATYTYAQASRGAFEEAAAPALAIVLIGVPPLVLLLAAGSGLRRRA